MSNDPTVSHALDSLTPEAAPDVDGAWQRQLALQSRIQDSGFRILSWPHQLPTSKFQIPIAAALILAVAFFAAPVRGLAAQFLTIFRVQDVTPITVDRVTQPLPDLSRLGDMSPSPREVRLQPVQVESLSAASSRVGFNVQAPRQLPAGLPSQPSVIAVSNGATVNFTFRAQKAGRPRSGSYDQFGARLTTSQPNPQGEWDGVAVAPSPVDPDAAVVVTIGNGVFSTEDGGASWTRAAFAPFEPFFGSFVRITIAPGNMSRVYLIARGPGLARSDDAGRSFRQLFAERLGAIAVDPTNPDVIYLGAFDNGHGLFKSVNGGNTVVSLGVPGNFSSLAVDPRHPQTVYAGNRAHEFELRLKGASYEDIAKAGGGIVSTVRATRAASQGDLLAAAQRR